jgi:hypothetical protein
MNPDTKPTQEEMDRYFEEVAKHELFIKNYRFFLDRIVNHLEFVNKGGHWTTDNIRKVMTSEIDMHSSCSAPNKPGYTYANND